LKNRTMVSPGTQLVDLIPARRILQLDPRAFFQHRDRVLADPLAFDQSGQGDFAQAFAIGRIEEGDVKGLADLFRLGAQIGGAAAMQLGAAVKLHAFHIGADRAAGGGFDLDKERKARPAADRFQPQRARPGEQIDHPRGL
jgi:hypothetical protein